MKAPEGKINRGLSKEIRDSDYKEGSRKKNSIPSIDAGRHSLSNFVGATQTQVSDATLEG